MTDFPLPDWPRIDVVCLDMDGTVLDLRFDNLFWLEALPQRWGAARGMSPEAAKAAVRRSNTLICALMVKRGEADAMLCGLVGRYQGKLKHVVDVLGPSVKFAVVVALANASAVPTPAPTPSPTPAPRAMPISAALRSALLSFNTFDASETIRHRQRMRIILQTAELQAYSMTMYAGWREVIAGRRPHALPADGPKQPLIARMQDLAFSADELGAAWEMVAVKPAPLAPG